ncbi:MAG: hypothetical protein Ct9H300mP14_07380 [Gammaproteobacteria bacterium]|nr:MAG: hypothetical protein Ct9H300mP14_07380 [Gammaproteobacteria bacterium]
MGGIAAIRKLNGIQKTQNLQVGDVLLLPVSEQTQASGFDQRRLEYHRVLVEEFKENFEVLNVQQYTFNRETACGELPVHLNCRFGYYAVQPGTANYLANYRQILRIPSIRKRRT